MIHDFFLRYWDAVSDRGSLQALAAVFFGVWLFLAVMPGLPFVIFLEKGSRMNRVGWAFQKFLMLNLVVGGSIIALIQLQKHREMKTFSAMWASFKTGNAFTLGMSFFAAGILLSILIWRLAPPEDKNAKGWLARTFQ